MSDEDIWTPTHGWSRGDAREIRCPHCDGWMGKGEPHAMTKVLTDVLAEVARPSGDWKLESDRYSHLVKHAALLIAGALRHSTESKP